MDWARMLAYGTGTLDQELLARNEYLAAENRIMKAQLEGQPKLSVAERGALGEIGHRLGRKVFADVASVARPDTILGWYRKLIARKFDGSKAALITPTGHANRSYTGRSAHAVGGSGVTRWQGVSFAGISILSDPLLSHCPAGAHSVARQARRPARGRRRTPPAQQSSGPAARRDRDATRALW
jgi:hypothetical protein